MGVSPQHGDKPQDGGKPPSCLTAFGYLSRLCTYQGSVTAVLPCKVYDSLCLSSSGVVHPWLLRGKEWAGEWLGGPRVGGREGGR